MAPVFLGFIAWEAWYWRGRRAVCSLRDTLSNAALALMHQAAVAVAWPLVIGVYWRLYQYRLFDLKTSAWTPRCSWRRISSTTSSTAPATASAGCRPRTSPPIRPNA